MLKKILKKSKGDLRFQYSEGNKLVRVIMLSNDTTFNLPGFKVAEYPGGIPLSLSDEAIEPFNFKFDINGKLLTDILYKIKASVSEDSLRLALTGIHVGLNTENNITFNATDGYTLQQIIVCPNSLQNQTGDTYPSALFSLDVYDVLKKIGNDIGNVSITFYNHFVDFVINCDVDKVYKEKRYPRSITLHTRLIDSKYPDVEEVIPTQNQIGLTLNRKDLLNSLELMEAFTDSENNKIILETDYNVNEISLNIDTKESGSVKKILACESSTCVYLNETKLINIEPGTEYCFGFNVRYLISALKVVSDEKITWQLNPERTGGSASIIHFEPFNGVIKSHLYIQMPVKNL